MKIMQLIKNKKEVEESLRNLLEKYTIQVDGAFQLFG